MCYFSQLQNLSKIRLGEVMAIFPKFKMAIAAILLLQKNGDFGQAFSRKGVTLHRHIKFDENPPIHSVEMALG